ncbi:hypothetical protein ACF3MZ_09745 [Paenibacillaceae bacterium WGS1546]|uniref:hypothetical protein n=1 Tax=Cohnella sp. WGS1546 TaxID=3366810 RepID=UPI00372D3C74
MFGIDASPAGCSRMDRLAASLRLLEDYGYSIAYYLLQDERLALVATRAALLEASMDRSLMAAPEGERKARFGKLAIRQAISVKRAQLRREA